MSPYHPTHAAWPARLRDLLSAGVGDAAPVIARQARGEAWLLLNAFLFESLNRGAQAFGGCRPEDLEDIAAQKSLDLVERAVSGAWDPGTRSEGEIVTYLGTVARNALVDFLRKSGRLRSSADEADWERAGGDDAAPSHAAPPDAGLQSREYADALLDCVARLKAQWRRIWFFRVFYEHSSKQIAAHPEVALKPSHVDVILQRSRSALRACMEDKGHDVSRMPPGTFAAMWEAFRRNQAGNERGEERP